MSLTQRLFQALAHQPERIVVVDHRDDGTTGTWRAGDIRRAAVALARRLMARRDPTSLTVVGIVAGNGAATLIADLACLLAGVASLPLPLAFSRAQAEHLAQRCQLFLLDGRGALVLAERWGIEVGQAIRLDHPDYEGADFPFDAPPPPEQRVCKIIHTSGTTSRPKGVMLSERGIGAVVEALEARLSAQLHTRYLSLVPFSLLLEQITGLYLPLLNGGTLHCLPASVPLLGESGAEPDRLLRWLVQVEPTFVAVPPVMITRLQHHLQRGGELAMALWRWLRGESAPYIACGGAALATDTLEWLDRHGISVYQGYGLSENGSVVSVNAPGRNRIGSVGQPLDHAQVRIGEGGTIEVWSESLFLGYSGEDPSACAMTPDGWLDTGDLGELDRDGFLYVYGRRKHVICLANGRNVCPERVELTLRSFPGVHDAVVFDDPDHGLVALLVYEPALDRAALAAWSAGQFSDIERPSRFWLVEAGAASLADCYTVTGRPRRAEIRTAYRQHIENRSHVHDLIVAV
ncbi:AMP-binding protein [Chitinimonas lacunae]|uniref:AMP-binding protein n=1 Tax=Chitinimonas lacunae TaxID=1963018 RepID=A0ABV8MVW1_9NEIS